mmetsp:Transcript_6414/g.6972  ORF Transcript_6414/g.6972 Transcript_6414/m.6972 type:complete len:423 (+) Transcript_6414:14-1282(+)
MKRCIIFTILFLFGLASATVPSPISCQLPLSAKKIANISRGGGENKFRDPTKRQTVCAEVSTISGACLSSDAATEAFIGNLQLVTAGILVWWATLSVPRYYVKQKAFYLDYVAKCGGADETIKFVNAIFPDTLSRAISLQNEVTGVLIGSLFSMSSLFLLSGRMGEPAVFPTRASAPMAIFHFFRMLSPFVSLFLIPKIPIMFNPIDSDAYGKIYQGNVHQVLGVPGFLISPMLEIIHSYLAFRKYFSTKPRGEKLVTDTDKRAKKVTLHRAMWFGFTAIKSVLCAYSLYTFIRFLLTQFPKSKKDSNPMSHVLGFILESRMIMSTGLAFTFLALAQLCECAACCSMARHSWVYMTPFTLLAVAMLKNFLVYSYKSTNINKNYVQILGMKDLVSNAIACSGSSEDNLKACCTDAYNKFFDSS